MYVFQCQVSMFARVSIHGEQCICPYFINKSFHVSICIPRITNLTNMSITSIFFIVNFLTNRTFELILLLTRTILMTATGRTSRIFSHSVKDHSIPFMMHLATVAFVFTAEPHLSFRSTCQFLHRKIIITRYDGRINVRSFVLEQFLIRIYRFVNE